jgi:hypothetical protein
MLARHVESREWLHLDRLPNCRIIYIGYGDTDRRRAVLSALKEQPMLTVGEAREFLWEGGMVQFQA